ncbi:MAG: hypothetical protein NTV25_10360 [Methanothrix sp.]|nr:hypothetical protein [Methanothrix sp.]
MAFVGAECLKVAQFLGGQTNSTYTLESGQRAVISRAYFAAYGHAFHHEVESRRYNAYNNGRDHSGLRVHFAKVRKEQKIASELADLGFLRKQCDYDKNFVGILSQSAKDALNKAKYVVEYLI